jgi:uncharacterized protein YbjT (DUF2867 family)
MTILITGATGTIGRQLARELLDRGASIRAASRRPEALADLAERGAETARIDLEDPSTLEPAFAGVDAAFVVGPLGGPDFGDRVAAITAAAGRAGLGHMVRYSALGANPDASFALARAHGIGDQHVKSGDVPYTIIQPTFYQDNLINFAGDTIRGEGAFYGASGDGAAAYISSADIVRVLAAILESPADHVGQTYTLTGPEALTATELASLATEVVGREIRYVDLAPEQFAGALRGAGMPDWIADSMVALEGIKRDGYAAELSPAVRELSGRDPETYRSFLERNRGKLARA